MSLFQSRVEKDFEQFVKTLPVLEPVEFAGLAKILSVPLVNSEVVGHKTKQEIENMGKEEIRMLLESSMRPMDEILEVMMDKYLALPKRRRKEINQILKEIKTEKRNEVKKNGASA